MRNRRWLKTQRRIQSYFVRERLLEHDSAIEAYQKGGMVKAEIDGILAAEFCQALLAPVVEAYADEKARILGWRSEEGIWKHQNWGVGISVSEFPPTEEERLGVITESRESEFPTTFVPISEILRYKK